MLKEIRAFYEIEQGLFADYLGISRSQLSMAEGGYRSISSQKMLQLLPLYQAITQPTGEQGEKLLTEMEEQRKTLQKKIKLTVSRQRHQLAQLKEKLENMKATHEKSLQILHIVGNLAATASANDGPLLKIIELNARKQQRKTALPHQVKLELKILHLQTELDYFQKKIDSV